jgi:hypothetical protein
MIKERVVDSAAADVKVHKTKKLKESKPREKQLYGPYVERLSEGPKDEQGECCDGRHKEVAI